MKLKFKTKPWIHQKKALAYLYKRDVGALYTKMGSGKTKVMIDLIRNREFKRVVIVAPKKACQVWEDEIKIHGLRSKFRVFNLVGMKAEEKVMLLKRNLQWKDLEHSERSVSNVIIINYESIWRPPLSNYLLRKTTGIDTVICDESHRIKSPSSKCSRYLARIGKIAQHRYLLTGTPLAENPMDVYAQYRFLDPSIFGTNFVDFCNEYQNIDPILTSKIGYTILDKKKPYKNLEELRKKMFSVAFCCEPSIQLPSEHSRSLKFTLEDEVDKYYTELEKEGILELKEGVQDTESVLALILREQQLTSGFIPINKEDGSTKIVELSNKRMKILYRLLKTEIKEEPVVIFAKFKKDLKNIELVCNKLGIGYSELSGTKDTLKIWKEGKTQVLAVQYTSGSESINLTRAHYCIYYSLHHSLALYLQSKKRIHRPGQTKPCVYYHIIATRPKSKRNTIDEDIIKALRDKKNIVDYIMNK